MHESTDPRVTELLASVRDAWADAPAPAPDARLQALFATGLDLSVAERRTETRRRPMFRNACKAVPGKVAAALLGATLAYMGLGAAGALPGPLSLSSSSEDADTQQVVELDDTTTTSGDDLDGTGTEAGGDAVLEESDSEDGDGEDGKGGKGGKKHETAPPTDLSQVAVPTSVSEAAHTHEFDEACGNHGTYVSHFARTGTEPECATKAREAAAEEGDEAGSTGAEVEAESDDKADKADKAEGESKGKEDGGKGKGKAAKGGKKGGKGRK